MFDRHVHHWQVTAKGIEFFDFSLDSQDPLNRALGLFGIELPGNPISKVDSFAFSQISTITS